MFLSRIGSRPGDLHPCMPCFSKYAIQDFWHCKISTSVNSCWVLLRSGNDQFIPVLQGDFAGIKGTLRLLQCQRNKPHCDGWTDHMNLSRTNAIITTKQSRTKWIVYCIRYIPYICVSTNHSDGNTLFIIVFKFYMSTDQLAMVPTMISRVMGDKQLSYHNGYIGLLFTIIGSL